MELLSGFWCEIQRKKHQTVFAQLHWSADLFTFDKIGVELQPGDYIITVFSRGTAILCAEYRIRRNVQTLIGVWVGGTNPRKPKGKTGILTYPGNIQSMVESGLTVVKE